MNYNIDILKNKVQDFKNNLNINPEYNRNPSARAEVEKRILKWENLILSINELNFSAIESTINIDMSQLDKDVFAINSTFSSSNNDTIKLAMQEAETLSGRNINPEKTVDDNISKLNKTRELMRRAGLL